MKFLKSSFDMPDYRSNRFCVPFSSYLKASHCKQRSFVLFVNVEKLVKQILGCQLVPSV